MPSSPGGTPPSCAHPIDIVAHKSFPYGISSPVPTPIPPIIPIPVPSIPTPTTPPWCCPPTPLPTANVSSHTGKYASILPSNIGHPVLVPVATLSPPPCPCPVATAHSAPTTPLLFGSNLATLLLNFSSNTRNTTLLALNTSIRPCGTPSPPMFTNFSRYSPNRTTVARAAPSSHSGQSGRGKERR